MKRLGLLVLPFALLCACSAAPPADADTKGSMPGVSTRMGSTSICIADGQSCSDRDTRCCTGSCQVAGPYGMLCRPPNN